MAADVEQEFTLINFNIDHFKLKQLNLKESRLTKIHIYQGNVKTLDAGLFPVSVKDLSLGNGDPAVAGLV